MTDVQDIYKYTKDLNILYVEDSPSVLESLSELFKNMFNHIDCASDGQEGYEKYLAFYQENKKHYDILISDIYMPNMNGLDMCSKILEKNRQQAIILTTAYDDVEYLLQALEMGIDGYITKPINNEQLFNTLYKVAQTIGNNKKINSYITQIEDLNNELKIKNEELEQNQILLIQQARLVSMGEMIANISHQWRQPLNTLALLIQKLTLFNHQKLLDDETIDATVSKSMSIINSMSTTIDDFRDFFKPHKDAEQFSLNRSIEQAYLIIGANLKHLNIDYTFTTTDDDITLFGHSNELSQVVLNILNNAKDAIIEKKMDHGKISVNVKQENSNVFIDIVDNAGGIDMDVLPKIFEPYYTTKEEGKGTGIGLYMSKAIIEDHMHGKISAKNTDNGTCFTIMI